MIWKTNMKTGFKSKNVQKVFVIIVLLLGFAHVSQSEPAPGIKYLISETADLTGHRSISKINSDIVTLMDFGINRLKDELSSGRLCPTRIDSTRPAVMVYYEKDLIKLKIILSYIQGSFGSTGEELKSVKSKIESFVKGLKSLCFAIKLQTGKPINGNESDLIKYFSHPSKRIPENTGAELDKITELEVSISSIEGTTIKCVSALLGKEMIFF